MARHGTDRIEHALVADTAIAQAFDQAVAYALRGHADADRLGLKPHACGHARWPVACASSDAASPETQLDTCSSAWNRVRSTWIGVIEMLPSRRALKSVPGPASCAAPAAPIHHHVRPRGSACGTQGSARWRLPSRVTSKPRTSSHATSGTLTLRMVSAGSGSVASLAMISTAARAAVS